MSTYLERQERLLHLYKSVFDSPEGAEVLEDMKRAHFFYASTVKQSPNGPLDHMAMALAEGERNVILRILSILEKQEG